MVVHYFILSALARELDEKLRQTQISELFSQQKNELCISFSMDSSEQILCVSVESGLNYCVLREGYNRAKKNSINLFEQLVDKRVESISIHPSDRVIILKTTEHASLCLQLYNTAASNIVLCGKDDTVLGSFKREKELAGTTLNFRTSESSVNDINREMLTGEVKEFGDRTTMEFLKHAVPLFGTLYAREICYRAHVEEQQLMSDLAPDQLTGFCSTVVGVLEECKSVRPTIYFEDDEPQVISTLPLEHLQNTNFQTYPTMNEAVIAFLNKTFRVKNFDEKKKELTAKLRRAFLQSERAVKAIQKELASSERAVEYEHTGHTIMANLNAIEKGEKEITLTDVFDGETPLKISLEPQLTAHQNAERYFEKSRKAKASRVESEERLSAEQKRVAALQVSLHDLEGCESIDDLKKFAARHKIELDSGTAQEEQNRIPFRVFTVAGGYEVWVGKSSANNDLLTTKYAKPNDLWFHARGAGGSHTVLRVAGKTQTPPHEAIMQTAAIAAYYSKMRNARNVPVSYCERKYVRKPKHAPEGTVLLEREEIVYVEPRLP